MICARIVKVSVCKMTVKELITILQNEDPELPVVIYDHDFALLDSVDHINLRIHGKNQYCVLLNIS